MYNTNPVRKVVINIQFKARDEKIMITFVYGSLLNENTHWALYHSLPKNIVIHKFAVVLVSQDLKVKGCSHLLQAHNDRVKSCHRTYGRLEYNLSQESKIII
jgi:hypothetical protein